MWICIVISHLSVGQHAVDEETFQSTMKYIFSFVEKVESFLSFSRFYMDRKLSFGEGKASGEHGREIVPAIPFGR